MLAISGNAKIFVHLSPIDLRKGFESLGAVVQESFSEKLTSGAYFVFLNRTNNRMKVLYWDSDGLAIWHKRLEKGTFSKRNIKEPAIDRREFFMLLEGITPRRLGQRYKIN